MMENKLINNDFLIILKHIQETQVSGNIIYMKNKRNTIIESKIIDFEIIEGIEYICLEDNLKIKVSDIKSFNEIIHRTK